MSASEVTVIIHDPNGRDAKFWNEALDRIVSDHDAEIITTDDL